VDEHEDMANENKDRIDLELSAEDLTVVDAHRLAGGNLSRPHMIRQIVADWARLQKAAALNLQRMLKNRDSVEE
jgi:hypothetical protein